MKSETPYWLAALILVGFVFYYNGYYDGQLVEIKKRQALLEDMRAWQREGREKLTELRIELDGLFRELNLRRAVQANGWN